MNGHTGNIFMPPEPSETGKSNQSSRSKTVAITSTVQIKYKTELCKNWVESGKCRYFERCRFAHGYDEQQPTSQAKRSKNCKTFHRTMQCPYGVRCMFNHESRHMEQIRRYYYIAKLYTFESLFSTSSNIDDFLADCDSEVRKLPIFEQISPALIRRRSNSDCPQLFSL